MKSDTNISIRGFLNLTNYGGIKMNVIEKKISTTELKKNFSKLDKSNVKETNNGNAYVVLDGVSYVVYHEGQTIKKTDKPKKVVGELEMKEFFDTDMHDRILTLMSGGDEPHQ